MDRKKETKQKILSIIDAATEKANAFSKTEDFKIIFGNRARDLDILREILKKSIYENDGFYDEGLRRYTTYANKASLIKEILQGYFEKKKLNQEGKELHLQIQILENTINSLG